MCVPTALFVTVLPPIGSGFFAAVGFVPAAAVRHGWSRPATTPEGLPAW
ncbi:hypothetical protein ACFXAE_00525 [Streptomyces sp. NPDC059454]